MFCSGTGRARELRKFNARGRRMCAPVGTIYGASILPYKLEGTRARRSKCSKKRMAAEHIRGFH